MSTAVKTVSASSAAKGRAKRMMDILEAMSEDERSDFFGELAETYCTTCGVELPDIDSNEPDHECEEDEDADEEDLVLDEDLDENEDE